MKKVIAPTLIIIMLLITSCTHNFEVSEDPNYTPPVVKSQPRLIYPKVAQDNAFSGTIQLYLQITPEGTVDKAMVIKSSGFKPLDDATVIYSKQLVFSPALKDGKPVQSRIQWVIKYDLYEKSGTARIYLKEIKALYKQIAVSDESNRISLEKKILLKYSELISEINDGKYFNNSISKIISSRLTAEWGQYWDSFPLTFLLYQDFIERFKDYNDISGVKTILKNSLVRIFNTLRILRLPILI